LSPDSGSTAWQQQQLVGGREEGEAGLGEEALGDGRRIEGKTD